MLDVLVVDDDPDVRDAVADALRRAGHRVTEATDGLDAVASLTARVFDLAICDVCMPKLDGHALLRRIRRESPKTRVVMMTTFATVSDAVGSFHDGAVNYIAKPFDVDELVLTVVQPLAERRSIARQLEETRAQPGSRSAGVIVARSPAMISLVGRISMLATSDAPVLVTGDKGVGKELVARTLHAQSPRRDGPLVLVEAADLLDHMQASAEAELSEERPRKDAWFRAASGGSLVIHDIDRLPSRAQTQLLRVIDEPSARARRGPSGEPLGVRILSLSREDLADRAARGAFLRSLYYRLNAVHLTVPSLRDRGADLCPLVAELLRELTPPSSTTPGVSARAWAALSRHDFRGNVRELRWALERALAASDGEEIDASHLPALFTAPLSTDDSVDLLL